MDAVAFFVHAQLTTQRVERPRGKDAAQAVFWDDNFVTLLPGEIRILRARKAVPFVNPTVVVAIYNDVSGKGASGAHRS